MDNCGPHKKKIDGEDIVNEFCNNNNITPILLPANCTPLIQPCDANLNFLFKYYISKFWSMWWATIGISTENLTAQGNPKAPSDDVVNGWVSKAILMVKPSNVINSWEHTLMGSRALECAKKTKENAGKTWEIKSLVKERQKAARERRKRSKMLFYKEILLN